MKMKNAFILLAAITLVACSSNASKLPSSSLEGDSSSSSNSVETTSDSSSTTTSTSSNNTGTSSNGGSSSSEPEDGVKKKTVTFLNGGFTNSSLDQPASRTQFVEWFNGSDNILDSITYTGYAQLNYIDEPQTPYINYKNCQEKVFEYTDLIDTATQELVSI